MADRLSQTDMDMAMLRGLEELFAKKVRERIMAIVQPDIDRAIAEAMLAFKTSLETHRDAFRDERVVKVILEDRRS